MNKYYKADDMENLITNIAPDGEVFELGLKALKHLPTIEVSEDCISREYLEEQLQQIEDITAMAHIDLGENPYDETEEITMPISTVRKIFKDAPSVVPTAEQSSMDGKWIADRYCSECEWDKSNADYTSGWTENYCPNCGADMRG